MDALALAHDLITFPTPSFESNVAITDYLEAALRGRGFTTERLEYEDTQGIAKACIVGKRGDGPGGLTYFGHSDVVPADDWFRETPGPFEPSVEGDRLYGRGSCDMKGSIACALAAADRLGSETLAAPLYIVVTADEEVGYVGAKHVVRHSHLYREMVDRQPNAIIGEPTQMRVVHGHKGVCSLTIISHGRAAHSSTREGRNANLAMIPFLMEMKAIHDETESDPRWQHGQFDPPSLAWNIGVNDHTRARNVKPARTTCTVYLRPMPGQDIEPLLERTRAAADRWGLEFILERNDQPMYTPPDNPLVSEAAEIIGGDPETVSFGTDGGQFHELRNRIVLGPGNIAQAHTWDEWIALEQLDAGTAVYERLMRRYCCTVAETV